jgi:hypothetical protein
MGAADGFQDCWGAGVMSPYIPRGYVTTADAVDHIFRARNPDLAASTSARESEMRQLYEHYCSEFPGDHPIPARLTDAIRLRDAASKRRAIIVGAVNWRDTVGILRQAESQLEEPKQTLGPFGEEDLARLRELDRIGTEQHRLVTDAAMELRAALAEGDLVAVLNYEEMPAVSQFRWRKDDGLTIVEKACLSHQMEGTHTRFVESAVVVKEADLVMWLGLNLRQTDGEVGHLNENGAEIRSATPTEVRGSAEHSQAPTGMDAQPAVGSGNGVGHSVVRVDPATRRDAGRPNAKNTSIELFNARRASGEALPKKQIQEAEAICQQWPSPQPPKPLASTVSGHISAVWRGTKADKFTD